jgi:hypothetical protein
MNKEIMTKAEAIFTSLSTEDAIKSWNEDPVAYIEARGFPLVEVSSENKEQLSKLLHSLHVGPSPEAAAPPTFGCDMCCLGIGATLTGFAAAIVAIVGAALVASDGAVGPAEVAVAPELEASVAAPVAVETGLSFPVLAKIFVAAFAGAGVEGFIGAASTGVCKQTGACA